MTDTYFKKTINFKLFDTELNFDIAETLFSTFQIDLGSAFLLRNLPSGEPKNILDIGCGYGVLGIYLAAKFHEAEVIAVDRDLLAVKYANINGAKNNLKNYSAIGSVGVEEVKDKKFDLIVSNIPAKIGDKATEEEFILKPISLLNEGGEYWFVIVSGINYMLPSIMKRNDIKLIQVKKRNGHIIYKFIK